MPEDREGVGIVGIPSRQDLDPLALPKREAKVLDAAVRAHENGLLREARPERRRSVEPGRALFEFEFRAVG